MANILLTNEEILSKVKEGLGITGTYQDNTLRLYIDEVMGFMLFAGINEAMIHNSVAVGVICRGVADLWNYGSGNAQLSEYFKQRVAQLALSGVTSDE